MKHSYILGALALIASTSTVADALQLPATDSGLLSVFPGQTARLNIVNLSNSPDPCNFVLSFIDSSGVKLLPAQPVVSLASGASTFLQTVGPSIGPPLVIRAHIDYSPQLTINAGQKDPLKGCYRLIPTLEVMDGLTTRVLDTAFYAYPIFISNEQPSKVQICHKPGTPAEKTLTIPPSALNAHLGHGDTLGACS